MFLDGMNPYAIHCSREEGVPIVTGRLRFLDLKSVDNEINLEKIPSYRLEDILFHC